MEKKEIVLTFLREAHERGIITSKAMEKADSFREDLDKLKGFFIVGSEEYKLCDSLDEKFYDLLGELKEEFFILGEISNQSE